MNMSNEGGYSSNPKDFIFQKDAFVEKFRPLTYYEMVTGRPIMQPIPNSKYVFHSNMQSMTTMLRFHQLLIALVQPIEKRMEEAAVRNEGKGFTNDAAFLVQSVVSLTRVMWELAIKPKNFFKRFFMWRAFLKACMDDTTWFFNLLKEFKEANTRLFFLTKYLANYSLHQTSKWKPTDYLPQSTEDAATRIKRRGLLMPHGMNLKKQAASANTN